MIHACPDREWYVDNYLYPSLLDQGIDKKEISIWMDQSKEGCLISCVNSFDSLSDDSGTWHLQDDVIISRDFAKRTKELEGNNVICGFVSEMFNKHSINECGFVSAKLMWLSFPCIYIPNKLAKGFTEWIKTEACKTRKGSWYIWTRKYDDTLFKRYLAHVLSDMKVFNLKPNLVDHVDYLLGGSVANYKRKSFPRAKYFEDLDLVEELEKQIKKGVADGKHER